MIAMRFRDSHKDGDLLCWGDEQRLNKGMEVQLRDEGIDLMVYAGGRNRDSPRL